MASSQRTIDREGAPAPLIAYSFRRRTATVLAVGLSLFTLVEVSAFLLEPLRQLAIFFIFSLPLPLSHGGYDLERVATTLALTQNGIFGIALTVMFDYIYLFIIFGTVYALSGGTEFIFDLAQSLFGRLTGGPAKISVLSSSLFGTISGSAVANVTVDGIFTIPMMKKTGFEPHVAGAIEAVTSTGGALMPPVMGAAAFIMAEYLGIPYISICKATAPITGGIR